MTHGSHHFISLHPLKQRDQSNQIQDDDSRKFLEETEIRRLEGALLFPDLTLMLESKYLLFSLSEIPSLIYFSRCNSFFRLLSFFSWVTISSGIRIRLNLDSVTMTRSMKEIRTNPNDCLSITAWCQISISKQEKELSELHFMRVEYRDTFSVFSGISLSFSLLKNWDHEYLSVYLIQWFQKKLRQESCIHHFSSLAGTTIVIFFWRRWSGSLLKEERKERRGIKISIMSIVLRAAPLLLHCNSLIVKSCLLHFICSSLSPLYFNPWQSILKKKRMSWQEK